MIIRKSCNSLCSHSWNYDFKNGDKMSVKKHSLQSSDELSLMFMKLVLSYNNCTLLDSQHLCLYNKKTYPLVFM